MLIGCSQTERVKNPSKLTLSVGTTIQTDEIYDDDNSLSLYLNYRYNQWDFSISNIQSFSQSDYLQDYSSSNNDFYLSAGYKIYRTSTAVRVGIGSKIADNSDTSQTSRKGKYAQNYTVDNSEVRWVQMLLSSPTLIKTVMGKSRKQSLKQQELHEWKQKQTKADC